MRKNKIISFQRKLSSEGGGGVGLGGKTGLSHL